MSSYDPVAVLPAVPALDLSSTDVVDGQELAAAQLSSAYPGGADRSPQLSWSGAPEGTRSYAVTVFDPDAPTMAGFWHWLVVDLPASADGLPAGIGQDGGAALPGSALQLRNDTGTFAYIGAAPPPGHGRHRYYFVVHALGVESLGITAETPPTLASFLIGANALARGVLVGTYETPAG